MASIKGASLPGALESVRKTALDKLNVNLNNLFNEADDWLFEQVDACRDGRSQQEYMDMMRMVRLQRATIEKRFLAHISKVFRNLPGFKAQAQPLTQSDLSVSKLTLVGHEEMEQSVALDAMSTRARREMDISLKMLEARLTAILPKVRVNQDSNPLDPGAICRALAESVEDADWDIKHQLIFFKLFQRYVLNPHAEIVKVCNELLENSGILKGMSDLDVLQSVHDYKPKSGRDNKSGKSAQAGQDVNQQQSSIDAKRFAHLDSASRNLSGLLSSALSPLAQPNLFNLPTQTIGSDSVGASVLALSELVSMLERLQHTSDFQHAANYQPTRLAGDLSNLIQERAPQRGPEKVNDVDANLINLVSMLFEYVLGDERLPERVKAVITRLQIPYVKLAVIDPAFLNSGKHPARQLINDLARAGTRLNEQQDGIKDVVYEKIEAVVQKALDEFVDDQTLFSELHADFQAFMKREEKRAEMVSRRVAALEEGKIRADLAKIDVSEALQQLINRQPMPEVMAKIIDQPWYAYLCWVHHNQGKDSPEWVRALYVVQQMLFCLHQVADFQEQENRQAVIEEVLDELRQGCTHIAASENVYGDWLADLESIFREKAALQEQPDLEALDADLDLEMDLLLKAAHDDAEKESEPSQMKNSDISKVTMLDVTHKAPDIDKPDLPPLDAKNAGMLEARRIMVGTWLEYVDDVGKIRCKLAAHLKSVDKMIFVNRSGAKLFEKTALEVAHDFNAKRFAVLDDSGLFDRALESVISGLRNVRERAV